MVQLLNKEKILIYINVLVLRLWVFCSDWGLDPEENNVFPFFTQINYFLNYTLNTFEHIVKFSSLKNNRNLNVKSWT